MSRMHWWAAVGCLVVASPTSAADGEMLAIDQLPPAVIDHFRRVWSRTEPLYGQKVIEGDRECYLVTALRGDETIEVYASPDGRGFRRKEAFSLVKCLGQLTIGAFVALVPAVIVGVVARMRVSPDLVQPLPPPARWVLAWLCGAGVLALIVFNLATVPRDKDVPVLAAFCVLAAATAASLIENVGLLALPGRGDSWAVRSRWVACFAAVAVVSVALAIPLEHWKIERENYHARQTSLRATAN